MSDFICVYRNEDILLGFFKTQDIKKWGELYDDYQLYGVFEYSRTHHALKSYTLFDIIHCCGNSMEVENLEAYYNVRLPAMYTKSINDINDLFLLYDILKNELPKLGYKFINYVSPEEIETITGIPQRKYKDIDPFLADSMDKFLTMDNMKMRKYKKYHKYKKYTNISVRMYGNPSLKINLLFEFMSLQNPLYIVLKQEIKWVFTNQHRFLLQEDKFEDQLIFLYCWRVQNTDFDYEKQILPQISGVPFREIHKILTNNIDGEFIRYYNTTELNKLVEEYDQFITRRIGSYQYRNEVFDIIYKN